MVFLYQYQDKGGFHQGEIRSGSEDEAHSALRKSGIHPMKVWPKPGLGNKFASFGPKNYLIVLLAVALVGSAVVLMRGRDAQAPDFAAGLVEGVAPVPRQQIPDVKVPFEFVSESTLSLFARPGDPASIEIVDELDFSDLEEALMFPLVEEEGDSPEALTLKGVVTWLKNEVLVALDAGESLEDVIARLVGRQRMEANYRKMSLAELRQEASGDNRLHRLKAVNAALREARIREISEREIEGEKK